MLNSRRLLKFFSHITGILFIAVAVTGLTSTIPTDEELRTIEIVGQDNLRYNVEEIRAKPGETLRIVYRTVSSMPAEAMSHNVAIVKPDTPMQEFINESMRATRNEYIAPRFKDYVIAATDMIGGGRTTEITFTVPEVPGVYPYVCTFPGHYAAGMAGKLIVEDEDEPTGES